MSDELKINRGIAGGEKAPSLSAMSLKILVLARHVQQGIGGIEIQCDLIARELAALGHCVTYAAPDMTGIDESLPYQLVAWPQGAGGSVTDLIVQHRPDVIYLRHNKNQLLGVAQAARAMKVPLVFAASSLQDIQPWSYHRKATPWSARRLASVAWQRIKSRWNWRGFHYVNAAVSLNPDYTDSLPVSVKTHIPDSMDSTVEPFSWPRPYVAWVAQLKDYKHPEAFVELASRCADLGLDFLMVGGLAHSHFDWITGHRGTPACFHYLGVMTPRQVNGFLAGSECMVHTCDPEGFGNNFIQAWQQGKATLSLGFDPGGLIQSQGLGALGGDMDGLERELRWLLANRSVLKGMEERALLHAKVNYDPKRNVRRLEEFLVTAIGASPG